MAYERAEILAGAAVLAVAVGFAFYAAQGRGMVRCARKLSADRQFPVGRRGHGRHGCAAGRGEGRHGHRRCR